MKNNRSVAFGVVIFTIIVIIVIVGSQIGFAPTTPKSSASSETPAPAITATSDPCADANIAVSISDFEKLSREFEDIYNIAAITASNQLTPLTTDLQRVRREAEDYSAPSCLSTLKGLQINYMNAYIEALMTLIAALQVKVDPLPNMTQAQYDQAMNDALSPYYSRASQLVTEAAALQNKYVIEKARLLGVTLAPTPTSVLPVQITATPTP
ncbi:MAG: hypothetical protein U0Z26_00745 [Anaerolineales bacterium]